MRWPLRGMALGCHALLVAALAVAVIVEGPTAMRALGAALLVTPLLLTWRGLATGRRSAERWLALLLVLYAGATSVEVVARAGAPLVSTALLAAVFELGLLLALIRQSPSRPRAARE